MFISSTITPFSRSISSGSNFSGEHVDEHVEPGRGSRRT
jgi:hypothetical protein